MASNSKSTWKDNGEPIFVVKSTGARFQLKPFNDRMKRPYSTIKKLVMDKTPTTKV